ncbi:TMEM175 family protein [Micromonospora sp. DR5-3]|uniref:TMEM175 family protein n=1 Tax=unclassified Micromonospora TaxID=2617518 RepID=UPI0011DC48C9|nr:MULTISPECIES: TMEM175 family protein [unclassified Micromonospora]MCW3818175.1 TMEM175 family protein [Micromonospora sp. DR5-3]TYC21363.1 DUF1211 domain-containing protein [Micromonospora sp. MP36]
MHQEPAEAGRRQSVDGHQRRNTLQRIVSFTDAAVAIALTLLALPLVNFADQSTARQSVADLVQQHLGDILSFAVSFLVIALFWRTHRQLYERLVDYDEVLVVLNTIWIMLVAFLPFPTARLFVETRLRADSAAFYVANMLAISLLALAQTWWIGRRPQLRTSAGPETAPALLPPVALCVVFAAGTLAAVVSPTAGLLLILLVPVAQFAAARLSRSAGG